MKTKPAKIPAPKTGNWKKAYGSWEGFVKEIHKSIGRKIGSGKLTLNSRISVRVSTPP